MSIMSLIRQRVPNPVLGVEHAQKLAVSTGTTHFDIHQDLEPLFAGVDQRFVFDVYSRLGWHLDTSLANRLRTLASKMVLPAGDVMTIDLASEIENQIEEIWMSEQNAEEGQGLSQNGIAHLVVAQLEVRERWHNMAAMAAADAGRTYTENSLVTVVGNPRKQEVSSSYRANAMMDALQIAGLLTDAEGRRAVSTGINHLSEIEEIGVKLNLRQEEMSVMKIEQPPEGATPKQVAVYNGLKRRAELLEQIGNMSDKVRTALEAYEHDMTTHKAQLQKFYDADLARIPVMLRISDALKRKLLVAGEEITPFYNLPTPIQVDACNQAMQALGQTLERMRDKPSYIYAGMREVCQAGCKLLQRVIDDRLMREQIGE